MSIATRLQESLSERGPTTTNHLERLLATTTSHEERVKRVSEAFDEGRLPMEVYVAVMGMRSANVRPTTPDAFVSAIVETLESVPSRTVVAVESYWRGKSEPKRGVDALFESLYLEVASDDEDDDEDEEGDDDEE